MTDHVPESESEVTAVMALSIVPVRYDPMDAKAEYRTFVNFADKLLTKAENDLEGGDLAGACIQYGQALGVAAVLAQLDEGFHEKALNTSLAIQHNLTGIHQMLDLAYRMVFQQVGIEGNDPLHLNDQPEED